MKSWQKIASNLMIILGLTAFINIEAANPANSKIRTVDFKKCVEQSKQGKQEQSSFEALKKQMEGNLAEKEKTLNELASKLEDHDYLDSLSPEAETEMKRKFRSLNQDYHQIQSQYLQALQQTNFKVIQTLTGFVEKGASIVAAKNGYEIVISNENCFYVDPSLDITKEVVAAMDQAYDQEPAQGKSDNTIEQPSKK